MKFYPTHSSSFMYVRFIVQLVIESSRFHEFMFDLCRTEFNKEVLIRNKDRWFRKNWIPFVRGNLRSLLYLIPILVVFHTKWYTYNNLEVGSLRKCNLKVPSSDQIFIVQTKDVWRSENTTNKLYSITVMNKFYKDRKNASKQKRYLFSFFIDRTMNKFLTPKFSPMSMYLICKICILRILFVRILKIWNKHSSHLIIF